MYRNNLKFIAIDSKYNVNYYKLPFFTVSTLTNEGHIQILAKSLLSDEKKSTI